MNTVLSKYQRPALSGKFVELSHPLVRHEGKAIHDVADLEEISEGYHLLFRFPILFFFFFFCWEARLPQVPFFWASLMEREIIMSWPVNNCMPQWDISHHDMQYVLHPDGPWPNREVPLLFFLSPTVSSVIYEKADRHAEGGKRNSQDLQNM